MRIEPDAVGLDAIDTASAEYHTLYDFIADALEDGTTGAHMYVISILDEFISWARLMRALVIEDDRRKLEEDLA